VDPTDSTDRRDQPDKVGRFLPDRLRRSVCALRPPTAHPERSRPRPCRRTASCLPSP